MCVHITETQSASASAIRPLSTGQSGRHTFCCKHSEGKNKGDQA